jgi:transcriptional regulator with XRE-family HTH domain
VTDIEFGRALRAIRHRRGWTQEEVGRRAGIPQTMVSRAERGQFESMSVRSVRAICGALEVRLLFAPSWRGGELDRLLDEDHAALTSAVVKLMQRYGWTPLVEVTFSRFGERGSIDVLGVKAERRAVVVNECKTDLTSTEALNRGVDRKARLAADIVHERLGWRPQLIGRLVTLTDTTSNRRRVAAEPLLDAAYPRRGPDVLQWLRDPVGPMAGLKFLALSVGGAEARSPRGRKRVRKPPARHRSATF